MQTDFPRFHLSQPQRSEPGRFPSWSLRLGKDRQALLASPADHLPQLVRPQLPGVPHHTHDSPVDDVFPGLLLLSHDASDLAVVEIHVAVTQPQDQHSHSGSQHLVHRPLELQAAHRGIDPLGMEVVGVVVVNEAGQHPVGAIRVGRNFGFRLAGGGPARCYHRGGRHPRPHPHESSPGPVRFHGHGAPVAMAPDFILEDPVSSLPSAPGTTLPRALPSCCGTG